MPSPTITYQGEPDNSADTVIESFNVNIAIKKGWHLAAKANSLSALRCDRAGANVYQFEPGLVVGDSSPHARRPRRLLPAP